MRKITTIEFDGVGKTVIDNAKSRVIVTIVLFSLCFGAVGVRLVDLGLLGGEARAGGLAGELGPTGMARADIMDRNGVLLATDLEAVSLYARPREIMDPAGDAVKLASVLPGLTPAQIEKRLRSSARFVWLKRRLTPAEHDAVNRLGVVGVDFEREIERVYPQSELAAHIIGYTDIDGKGAGGVERYFDERLRDDAAGMPLQLAMDVRVQHALREEIGYAIRHFRGKAGAGIVLDVHTGEIVAMASLPDFNPNDPGRKATNPTYMNRITHGVYEMGSTFKTFTVAMALEHGVVDLKDGYDATHPIRVSRFTINDDHPQARYLTVPEIFMHSSNIGSVKMAMDTGRGVQREFLARLGMLSRPDIELHEVGMPLVPSPWRDINTMTIAYGHGVAVSGLQVASGVATLTNGGIAHPITLLKTDPAYPVGGERVVSEETSRQLQAMMRLVVENGTGRQADVKGYLVGGKTGTAEKPKYGGYSERALITSFVAVFPVTNPRYVVFVMLDEPRGIKETHGFAGAGWNAAPTTGRVIERIAPLLGVAPTMDLKHPLTEQMQQLIRPEVRS